MFGLFSGLVGSTNGVEHSGEAAQAAVPAADRELPPPSADEPMWLTIMRFVEKKKGLDIDAWPINRVTKLGSTNGQHNDLEGIVSDERTQIETVIKIVQHLIGKIRRMDVERKEALDAIQAVETKMKETVTSMMGNIKADRDETERLRAANRRLVKESQEVLVAFQEEVQTRGQKQSQLDALQARYNLLAEKYAFLTTPRPARPPEHRGALVHEELISEPSPAKPPQQQWQASAPQLMQPATTAPGILAAAPSYPATQLLTAAAPAPSAAASPNTAAKGTAASRTTSQPKR